MAINALLFVMKNVNHITVNKQLRDDIFVCI